MKAVKRERIELQWFIEPLDEETNEILAKILPEENAIFGCRNGKKRTRHNVWLCQCFDDVRRLLRSRLSRGIEFKIFYRQKGEREITECALLSRVPRRRLSRISGEKKQKRKTRRRSP